MNVLGRFARYLLRDDRAKETYLVEVEAGADENEAVEAMNARVGTEHTPITVRAWLRDDQDFAKALRVARRRETSSPTCHDLNAIAAELDDPNAPPPPGSSDLEIAAQGWRVLT